MPQPFFTSDEQYAVNFAKSRTKANPYLWGYLVGALVLGGFGMYRGSLEMLATSFVVLVGFRLYEELYQRRWVDIWCGIIEKYEAEIARLEASGPHEVGQSAPTPPRPPSESPAGGSGQENRAE